MKRILPKLPPPPPQVVLLDMEAGVEHLGRGTIAGVDYLLIVVIPSKSGVRTALKIKKLAEESGIPRISFVGNLVADNDDRAFLTETLGQPPLACFPDSAAIRKTERAGLPITGMLAEVEEAAGEVARQLIP